MQPVGYGSMATNGHVVPSSSPVVEMGDPHALQAGFEFVTARALLGCCLVLLRTPAWVPSFTKTGKVEHSMQILIACQL